MEIVSAEQKIVDKLVDECAKTVEEVKLANITLAKNENSYKYSSCTVYIVLFSIFFTVNVGIVIYFVYSHWYLKKMFYILTYPFKQQFTKHINGKSQTNEH